MLCPRISVFDLECDAKPRVEDDSRMHSLRADFGYDPSARFLDYDRIESIGSADEERMPRDRRNDSRGDVFISLGGTSKSRVRSGHLLEGDTEHGCATSIDRDANLSGRHARPQGNLVEHRLLYGMVRPLVRSEERRVGKGCGYGSWRDKYEDNVINTVET